MITKLYYKIFGFLSKIKQKFRYCFLWISGYRNISKDAIIESGVILDRVYREGVIIKGHTLIAANTVILTHEHVYRDKEDPFLPYRKQVTINERVFIGVGAIILPGTFIESDVVVAAGALVKGHIKSGSLVIGNPMQVIQRNYKLNNNVHIIDRD